MDELQHIDDSELHTIDGGDNWGRGAWDGLGSFLSGAMDGARAGMTDAFEYFLMPPVQV